MIKVHLQKRGEFIGTVLFTHGVLVDIPRQLNLSIDINALALFTELINKGIVWEIDSCEIAEGEIQSLLFLATINMIVKAQWTLNNGRVLTAFGQEYRAYSKQDMKDKLEIIFNKIGRKKGVVAVVSYSDNGMVIDQIV